MARATRLYLLIVTWWAGAITAGLALLIPYYSNYLAVAAVGWITVLVSTGLILYEMRKIKAEDRKKSGELEKGGGERERD